MISYRQLGATSGLGAERARFDLTHVIDEAPNGFAQVLYAGESGSVNLQPNRSRLDQLLPGPIPAINQVSLRFLTPTRLKQQSKITHAPTFRDLCAALLRRLSQLVLVHGNGQWKVDEAALLSQAEQVTTQQSDLKPITWARFSSRQQQSIRMGGVVGEITFQGPLQPFLSLLWAGQWLHIGRGSTFGNGQYQVRVLR